MFKELFVDRQKDYFLYDYQFYKPADRLFNDAVNNIVKCSSLAAEFNVPVDVVVLPYEFQIRNFDQRELFKPQQLLMKELSLRGIKCFDPSEYFKPYVLHAKSLYLFGDGIHFSKFGHRVMAKILSEHFFD